LEEKNMKKLNMGTFKIEVKETLSRIIEIDANCVDEAFSLVKAQCQNEEIVLEAVDFLDTGFLKLED